MINESLVYKTVKVGTRSSLLLSSLTTSLRMYVGLCRFFPTSSRPHLAKPSFVTTPSCRPDDGADYLYQGKTRRFATLRTLPSEGRRSPSLLHPISPPQSFFFRNSS